MLVVVLQMMEVSWIGNPTEYKAASFVISPDSRQAATYQGTSLALMPDSQNTKQAKLFRLYF